jgi:hypothetical protein
MEGAARFTDVSGVGLVLVGLTALGAAFLAAQQPTLARWLAIWLAEAVVASTLSFALMHRKIRSHQAEPTGLSAPARKFLFAFWPAIAAGAAITFALVGAADGAADGVADPRRILAGIWLLLYGVGVMGAGAFSVRAVPLLGLVFLALGPLALFVPALPPDALMAAGFGVAHILVGLHISRSYGG